MISVEETDPKKQLVTFGDHHGRECSLQISTVSESPALWMGCNELGLSQHIPGLGWQAVDLEGGEVKGNTRMHLTKEQVSALLPLLTRFVEEGVLVCQEKT